MEIENKKLKDCSIEDIANYLEDKGHSVIKTTELEHLEYRDLNHPG